MAPMLLLIGTLLLVSGLVLLAGERVGLGLPGDIVIERESGTRIYIPIATSLVLSALLTAVLWFIGN
jgi:hypothetical protein